VKVELIAALPTGRTAVAFTGEGDAKVSLDTSADQLAGVLAILLKMRGKALKVTFETDEV
jgi:hypothetical protein